MAQQACHLPLQQGVPRRGAPLSCCLGPQHCSFCPPPFPPVEGGSERAGHWDRAGAGRAPVGGRGGREEPGHSCFENLFGLGIWGTQGRAMDGRGTLGTRAPDRAFVGRPRAQAVDQISVDSMRSRREGVQAFFSSPCGGVGVLAPPAVPRSRSRRSSCWLRWYIST